MNLLKKIFLAACITIPTHQLHSPTLTPWTMCPALASAVITLSFIKEYGRGTTFKEKFISAFKNHRKNYLIALAVTNTFVLMFLLVIDLALKVQEERQIEEMSAWKKLYQAEYEKLLAEAEKYNQVTKQCYQAAEKNNQLHIILQNKYLQGCAELETERTQLRAEYDQLKAALQAGGNVDLA